LRLDHLLHQELAGLAKAAGVVGGEGVGDDLGEALLAGQRPGVDGAAGQMRAAGSVLHGEGPRWEVGAGGPVRRRIVAARPYPYFLICGQSRASGTLGRRQSWIGMSLS